MNERDLETMQAVLMRNVEGYQANPALPPSEEAPLAAWTPPSRTLH